MAFAINVFGKELFSFRSLENPNNSLSDPDVVESLIAGGSEFNTLGGSRVTPETALSISAFYRGVALLSSHMASFPLNVYEKIGDKKMIATNHPAYNLLHYSPNPLYNSYIFREVMMLHLLVLDGNFFAIIERDNNYNPKALWICDPKKVKVVVHDGQKWYFIQGYKDPFPSRDILHVAGMGFDGVRGFTPLSVAAKSLGYSLTLQKFSQSFFKNGAHIAGVVEHPSKMTPDQFRMFKSSWRESYSGAQNTGSTAILQGGAKFNKIGIAPEEAQFIESKKLSVTDIARYLGIPPHKIYDLTNSTNNNIEHQSLEYLQDSLIPWLTRTEMEYDQKLTKASERGRIYTKHNVNALLRGDSTARGNFYSQGINAGWITPDEVRSLEDKNPMGGLAAELHFPVNTQTETQIKQSNANE